MPPSRTLLAAVDDARRDGLPAVLCSVVRVDGSGYGRPGARLLLTGDGGSTGYVSGGCLERELARRAWPATERGPATLAFDTRGNPLDPAGDYNAGCDGVVHILCERLKTATRLAVADRRRADAGGLDSLARVLDTGESAVVPVVYRSDDPALPVGTRADFGPLADAVGEETRRTAGGRSHTRAFRTAAGLVEVAFERVEPPVPLVIFGAGDDAVPLAETGVRLGWDVTVAGKQPELAARDRFPGCAVRCGVPAVVLGEMSVTPRTAAVVMTHIYADDLVLLPALLNSPAGYVGLLGPKRRAGRLAADLHARGGLPDPRLWERLRTPVGLDLGAVTPAEIALAVAAEILAARRDRPGGPLAARRGPIHDPQEHVA